MNTRTLAAFLAGSDRAIGRIAADRRAPWAGVFLALVAGVARAYDRHSVLHEPWVLIRPLAVATLEASLAFWLVYPFALFRRERDGPGLPRYDRAWLMFLSLFWMTSPVAFLHAIPWEACLDPGPALGGRIATTAVVVGWRIALASRIVTVAFGTPTGPTLWLVALAADIMAIAHLGTAPELLVGDMHGAYSDPLRTLVFYGQLVTLAALIPLLTGVGKTLPRFTPWWTIHRYAERGRPGWVLAVLLAAGAAALLRSGQPPLQRAERADALFAAGQYAELLEALSTHDRSDYPARWSVPPMDPRGVRDPIALAEALGSAEPPEWVRSAYMRKIDEATRLRLWPAVLTPWPTIVEGVFRGEAPPDRANTAEIVALLEFLLRAGAHPPAERAAIAQTRDILKP